MIWGSSRKDLGREPAKVYDLDPTMQQKIDIFTKTIDGFTGAITSSSNAASKVAEAASKTAEAASTLARTVHSQASASHESHARERMLVDKLHEAQRLFAEMNQAIRRKNYVIYSFGLIGSISIALNILYSVRHALGL